MKNIVITGASRGIGKAIALEFAQHDFALFISARKQENCEALKHEILTRYPSATIQYFIADMSIEKEVLAFCDFVKQQISTLDILVNNAGVFLPGQVHNLEKGVMEKVINTNLYSAFYTTRALMPLLNTGHKAHIFTISSIAGLQAYPNGGAYTVSKYALQGFNDALRDELKNSKIRVTSVNPGATLTDSWAGVDLPEDRFIDAEDIAKTIYDIYTLSHRTVIEKIVIRPQQGDI